MCRNIRTLHNFEPPATEDEIRASSLQYVRKVSGFTKPSKANAEAFQRAVDAVAGVAGRAPLLAQDDRRPRLARVEPRCQLGRQLARDPTDLRAVGRMHRD